MRPHLPRPCLLLVTDRRRTGGRPLRQIVELAVEGGVDAVQLREPDLPAGELLDLALKLRAAIAGRALFFVNDRADVALAAGADGIHLPEQGLPAAAVRGLAGEDVCIGRSVHSIAAAQRACQEDIDYLTFGNVFETTSHPGRPAAGLATLEGAVGAVERVRPTPTPVLAIGGITAANVRDIIGAGALGIAVISAISEAPDPSGATTALRAALDEAVAGLAACCNRKRER